MTQTAYTHYWVKFRNDEPDKKRAGKTLQFTFVAHASQTPEIGYDAITEKTAEAWCARLKENFPKNDYWVDLLCTRPNP